MSDMFEHVKNTSRKIHKEGVTVLACFQGGEGGGLGGQKKEGHFLFSRFLNILGENYKWILYS